nr:retrovirus-related Pol polyprotein from transposon TNT 1-94 [Tanacetum cinerariifolium]
MATKGNLGEVVTTCVRSWVQASSWGFSFRSEKGSSRYGSMSTRLFLFGLPGIFDFGGRDGTLSSKEIKERSKEKVDDGEGLYVRGRTDRRNSRQSKGSQQQRLEVEDSKCDGAGYCSMTKGSAKSEVLESGRRLNANVEEKDSLMLVWHKRPGQISEAGLQVLKKQGKMYFLFIVDDYSKRVRVYILRFKHEAFGKFKKWKQLVENQTGRMVKKLRTDNRLKFCNQEFKQLCIRVGLLDI